MDPVTLFLAAMAGGGKLLEGFAGSDAAKLQQRIVAGNTALLDKQAAVAELGDDVARAKGAFEETRLDDRIGRVLAAGPGRAIAAGLSPTGVSPLVAEAFSASQGQMDREILRANTALEAANARARTASIYGAAATSAYNEEAMNQKALMSKLAGVFGAGTAFLSTYDRLESPGNYRGGSRR